MALVLCAVLLFVLPALFAGIAVWGWMLTECLVHEPNDGPAKPLWAVLILATGPVGALGYWILRRGERLRLYGE